MATHAHNLPFFLRKCDCQQFLRIKVFEKCAKTNYLCPRPQEDSIVPQWNFDFLKKNCFLALLLYQNSGFLFQTICFFFTSNTEKTKIFPDSNILMYRIFVSKALFWMKSQINCKTSLQWFHFQVKLEFIPVQN